MRVRSSKKSREAVKEAGQRLVRRCSSLGDGAAPCEAVGRSSPEEESSWKCAIGARAGANAGGWEKRELVRGAGVREPSRPMHSRAVRAKNSWTALQTVVWSPRIGAEGEEGERRRGRLPFSSSPARPLHQLVPAQYSALRVPTDSSRPTQLLDTFISPVASNSELETARRPSPAPTRTGRSFEVEKGTWGS